MAEHGDAFAPDASPPDAEVTGPECAGYQCRIEAASHQAGTDVRRVGVVCEGSKLVTLLFCYSKQPECYEQTPTEGDEVCLVDDPGQGPPYIVETECQNDPCCVPCPDEPTSQQFD